MNTMDTIGLITAICGLVWVGIFVVIIPVYFITKDNKTTAFLYLKDAKSFLRG